MPFLGQTGRGGGIVAISTHVPEASTHWRLSSPRSSYFQVWSWVQFSDIQGTAILEGSLDSFRSLPGTTFKHLSCYLFPDRVPRTPDQGPFSFHGHKWRIRIVLVAGGVAHCRSKQCIYHSIESSSLSVLNQGDANNKLLKLLINNIPIRRKWYPPELFITSWIPVLRRIGQLLRKLLRHDFFC